MSIKVINGGLMTTVQDSGRYGMQAGGMQVSGVMDYPAALLANLLVGNEADAVNAPFTAPMPAVLESTCVGPELEFEQDALVAVTGGLPEIQIDGMKAAPYRALIVRKGQKMKVCGQRHGMRAYLAIAGGIDVPKVLGSRSTNLKLKLGGFQGRKLTAGDVLPLGEPQDYAQRALAGQAFLRQADGAYVQAQKMWHFFEQNPMTVHVVPGPQDEYFSQEELAKFSQAAYVVSNESDRMGYRLSGPPVEKILQQDLITDGIVFGSIQIPPNGQPIIMLADHQTTGGYPKLATVATVDLPLLAQAMPGKQVKFQFVAVQAAQRKIMEWARDWQRMAEQIRQADGEIPQHTYGCKAKRYQLRINGQEYDVVVEPVD